jgi:hypothetical protein
MLVTEMWVLFLSWLDTRRYGSQRRRGINPKEYLTDVRRAATRGEDQRNPEPSAGTWGPPCLAAKVVSCARALRGMRDESFLLLKLKWETARPIRFARDYARFLGAEPLHSDR